MGACASRPKDLKKGGPPPSEAPITPKKPQVVDPASASAPLQDDEEGETTNKELLEPLVDVSEVPAAPEANTKVEEKAEAAIKEEEKEKDDKTQHSNVVQA